ncbi:protein windbeutel [Drosophila eugracilis]|uniref:protein windbeutel n=1 Tax=Drosophila eugracilis TaxID=29029 RepID=UPI0007E67215|nr:protein windbeutel [Drosophila eugracilis]
MMRILVTLLLAAFHSVPSTWAISCTGCVDLDELNFQKTVERFPYALVKFDIAFPYGEKHEAFAAFSKSAHRVTKDLLIATVGIKDYGELENKALGDRYKVDDKNFPAIFLFKGNAEEYIPLPSHMDVTLDNLKAFVSGNTPLYIGPDGCLKEYSDALRNYANLPDEEQLKLIEKLEAKQEQLASPEEKQSAKAYLIYMNKIHELGYGFLEEENKRLQRLKAGKVSAAKKEELLRKLNILEAFRVHKVTKAKGEKQEL